MRYMILGFLGISAIWWAIVGLGALHLHHHHVYHVWPVRSGYFLPVFAALMGWGFLSLAVGGVVVWLVRGE